MSINLSLLLIIICAVSTHTSECLLPVKLQAYIVPVFGELLDLDFPPNNSTILWVHVGNHSNLRHDKSSKDSPSLWKSKLSIHVLENSLTRTQAFIVNTWQEIEVWDWQHFLSSNSHTRSTERHAWYIGVANNYIWADNKNSPSAQPNSGIITVWLYKSWIYKYLKSMAYLCCKLVPYFCNKHIECQSKSSGVENKSVCFDDK